jgi:hypothetical protein
MKRLFAAVCAVACVVGSTSGFAAGGSGVGRESRTGIVNGSGFGGVQGSGIRAQQNRIPAPLPPPSQAPVINGPMSQNPLLPPMGAAGMHQ